MALIELRDVSKAFRRPPRRSPVLAVDDVDLDIEDGEIFGDHRLLRRREVHAGAADQRPRAADRRARSRSTAA